MLRRLTASGQRQLAFRPKLGPQPSPKMLAPPVAAAAIAMRFHSGAPRRNFQPFSEKDEQDLLKVVNTKPRHVLKHVRTLVWRNRKRELHFRNTVTQLMIVVQDFLKRELIEPKYASIIMEGILEECVKLSQHDMAHLMFRAFLRFRKYGCVVSLDALRYLFQSYKDTDNSEMMFQLANELRADPDLRAFCIAAYLFAGRADLAEALRTSVPPEELEVKDIVALLEGYDKLKEKNKIVSILQDIELFKKSKDELGEIFAGAFKIFQRNQDDESFAFAFDQARRVDAAFPSEAFATVLRMRLRTVQTLDEVTKVEQELGAMGYVPDMTGNSVIISAYARMLHFGDKASETVMLSKVDTLLGSIETRLQQGEPDMEISSAHLRAVIRGYGAAGRPELMRVAWERMQYKGISNDTRVFNELLKWFSLMGNVKEVLSVKNEMASQQVQPDAVTYTWVIRALGKYYPRQIDRFYDEIKDLNIRPDVSLYTALIGVFGDLERFEEVDEIVAQMRKREDAGTLQVSPNTYAVLLRIFVKDIEKVERVYADAVQRGVGDHEHVVTSLLHAYASHKDGDEKLNGALAKMPQWSTSVYNVMLHRLGKLGDKDKMNELVERMKRDRVDFNDVTYGTLITVYGKMKDVDRISEIVEMMKSHEGQISANFYSILAATYSKLGDADGIDNAWEDLQNSRLFPDTETYNQFLTLYSKHHNVHKMQNVMDSMMKKVPPNPVTATTVVDMLGKAGRLADMEQLVEDMKAQPETAPTSVTMHQVMNAYAKAGDVGKMDRVHQDLIRRGFEENAVTFNILADGYGRARRFEQLADLIARRREKKVPMEELGYCVLISTYGRVRLANDVHRLAAELRALPEVEKATVMTRKVVWALVDAYCRCNEVAAMQEWITELGALSHADRMQLLAYFCRVGMMERAEDIAAEGEKDGQDVNFPGLNAMAKGHAKVGRFDKAVEWLHKMRDRKLVPDAATTLAMSQMFIKAGLHEQAQQIVQWRRQYARSYAEESEEVIV